MDGQVMVNASIDGIPLTLPAGRSVLQALQQAGIHVPALCHDDRLASSGACRTCLVRVKGLPKLVSACTTELADGMEIETSAPEVETARRGVLEMLVRHYPGRALQLCPDKPFHVEIRRAGLADCASSAAPDPARVDRSHPYIAVDMDRCIHCYRCVRICSELQGQSVWHVRGRGLETRVVPDGPTLRESSCVGCGACVDTCPTGALEDATSSALTTRPTWTRTTCPYCGVGCELEAGTSDGHIVAVRPPIDAPVNKGHLCVKGRYAFGFVSAPDRITEPMIRDGASWRTVSWTEARAFVVERLQSLMRRHGPDSIGVLGSARATNEDNYLAQKLARTVIGTNNVDCCARVCHAPSAAALKLAFGAGLATNSFDDIERAATILVCGANATEDHPVIGARIKQAAARGARLIVIDPRRIELAEYADCHLALRPGTNIPLLNAMAHVIVTEHLHHARFIEQRVSSWERYEAFISAWTPERAAEICGVDADDIRRAARLYATAAPAMSLHGLGLTEHVQGTDGVTALINLALLTGNLGVPGAGVNPLRGQNNVQGSAHMGCDPALLPGSVPIERGRAAYESLCGTSLPATRGLNLMEMMDAATDGRLKALWAIGYDVLMTNPNATETLHALRQLELVVVQDLFMTETARQCATVFLPACSSFEKDGTFMNAERRVQRVRAALRPLGQSKPDWRILCEIGRAMGGRGFAFTSPEDIWNEVRAFSEGARGMTYARLDERGLQWPCPTERHPGTPLLHVDTFVAGPRAALQAIDYHPTPEVASTDYPLTLITGRSLYQFNAGTMTGRTANNELRPADVLDVAAADAARLSLEHGQRVRVTSRHGTTVLPVAVTSTVQPGQLFATFQQPASALNAVTGPCRDGRTSTPEYKVTAVRVEPL
jgi:formate dehydrogenase major subunit